METAHRYILEPYKGMNTRYRCPSCQQGKTLSLYIDTETGEHIHPTVGRCNRESKCGHHYTPKQYFQDNNISFDTTQPKAYRPKPVTPQQKPVSFIPVEVFKASLKGHEANHFVKFLINLFSVEVVSELISRYFIATSKHWNGATVFWQIDTQGKVRTGKVMLYNASTGKRVKEPFNHINWVHKAIKQPEFELRQCLFGEHLLVDKSKPIAIVESEKTAVIASVYLPQFIWLAVGSLTNLNVKRCSVLERRTVILFPDLNAFDKWSSKANELSHLAIFKVSDLLERKAAETERKQGFDIADYLIKQDWRLFRKEQPTTEPKPKPLPIKALYRKKNKAVLKDENLTKPNIELLTNANIKNLIKPKIEQPENWKQDITELENFFKENTLPTHTIKLNPYSTITDINLFVDSHFATVKHNNGKQTFLPYLNRLQELKGIIQSSLII